MAPNDIRPPMSLDVAIWLRQHLGTPDECRDWIQQVKDTAVLINGAIPYDEDLLEAALEDSKQAQATLDSHGVIYDPETKSAKIAAGEEGGHPYEWINYKIGNEAEFLNCHGVGQKKLADYGELFLNTIQGLN